MLKKIVCIIFIILIITCIANNVLAMSIKDLKPNYTVNVDKVQTVGQELLGIIRNVAAISGVVILAFIGLKIMFGSVDQRAEYKKSLIPLIIGIFVVVGATTIVSTVWKQDTADEWSCQHYSAINRQPSCNYDVVCEDCGAIVYKKRHSSIIYRDGRDYCTQCGQYL